MQVYFIVSYILCYSFWYDKHDRNGWIGVKLYNPKEMGKIKKIKFDVPKDSV
jgi:hypothetical protein